MRAPSTVPYLPEARWSIPDALLVLAAGLAAAVLVGSVVVTGSGDAELGVPELSATLAGQSVGSLLTMAWMSRRRGSGDWGRDFGLVVRVRDTWGFLLGFGLQVLAALVIAPLVDLLAPEGAPRQEITEVAAEVSGSTETLVFVFLVVFVAPLVEEVVFRGMLLSRLRRSVGPVAAVLWSAAAFAAIHLLDPNALYAVPGLFVVGVALGWMALRSGDLSLPIFIHAGVNLTGALVLILS